MTPPAGVSDHMTVMVVGGAGFLVLMWSIVSWLMDQVLMWLTISQLDRYQICRPRFFSQ